MIVSIHKPKTMKPNGISDFGFFLAGLIDSDGHFSKMEGITQLVVCFHEKEMHIPYYLKKKIGYGIVSKVKNKKGAKGVKFIMAHSLGLEKVCALVHNKLQHKQKIIQYNSRLHALQNYTVTEKQLYPLFSIKENPWFTGFFLGYKGKCCFQIKIIEKTDKEKGKKVLVRALIEIDQKTDCLLLQIKNAFGGNVFFRKTENSFYYSTVNFASTKKVVQYFDRFHLMGIRMTQYVLWRKVFLKIIEKYYDQGIPTELDYKWITNVKKRMIQ